MPIYYSKTIQEGGQNMFIRFFRASNGTDSLQSFVLTISEVNTPEKIEYQVMNLSMLARRDDPALASTTDQPILID